MNLKVNFNFAMGKSEPSEKYEKFVIKPDLACKKAEKIFFLKTSKTGSTTVANIIQTPFFKTRGISP